MLGAVDLSIQAETPSGPLALVVSREFSMHEFLPQNKAVLLHIHLLVETLSGLQESRVVVII